MASHSQNPPSTTVYARNLPYEVTEDEVRKHFEPAGIPSRVVLSKDKETGRFKGHAFVTFPSLDIAEAAVRNLNQITLKGREIFLDFSRNRDQNRDRDRGDLRERGPDLRGRPPRDRTREPPDMRFGGAAPGMYDGSAPGPPQFQQYQQVPGQYPGPGGGMPGAPQNGMMQPQGAPQGLMFPPGGQQQGPATIIVQADGRQVILPPGQQPPMNMVQQMPPPGLLQGGLPPVHGQAGPGPQDQPLQQMGDAGPSSIPRAAAGPPGGVMGAPQVVVHQSHVKAPNELHPDAPIGLATAMHANQQMANALGAAQTASAPSQQMTSNAMAGMTPKQLHRILAQLKDQLKANPVKGRAVLLENLPLTKALFQAQILLGMVNPDQKAEGADVVTKPEAAASPAPEGGAPASASQQAQPVAPAQEDPQQLAMLRQVMALSVEDIANLPPEQRADIERVKEYARSKNLI